MSFYGKIYQTNEINLGTTGSITGDNTYIQTASTNNSITIRHMDKARPTGFVSSFTVLGDDGKTYTISIDTAGHVSVAEKGTFSIVSESLESGTITIALKTSSGGTTQ